MVDNLIANCAKACPAASASKVSVFNYYIMIIEIHEDEQMCIKLRDLVDMVLLLLFVASRQFVLLLLPLLETEVWLCNGMHMIKTHSGIGQETDLTALYLEPFHDCIAECLPSLQLQRKYSRCAEHLLTFG
ncbi:hypothetical protein ACOSQ4_009247 [Xanthoceras sorbifolium]